MTNMVPLCIIAPLGNDLQFSNLWRVPKTLVKFQINLLPTSFISFADHTHMFSNFAVYALKDILAHQVPNFHNNVKQRVLRKLVYGKEEQKRTTITRHIVRDRDNICTVLHTGDLIPRP